MNKVVCGIDLDKDYAHLSFSRMKGDDMVFFREAVFNRGMTGDFLLFFRDNIADLRALIDDNAIKHKFKVENIYIKLHPGVEKMTIAEDVVALSRTKKVSPADIAYAKKYLEDNAIDWDDFCIHHFPLNFGIEGKAYESMPVGFWTKRIRIRSLLVTVKDRLRLDMKDIFDNYDMPFGGFISTGVSDFSTSFTSAKGVMAVVNIGYDTTLLTIARNNILCAVESFDFGVRYLVDAIAREFSISEAIAREIFELYVAFGISTVGNKSVSVKDGDEYINISISRSSQIVEMMLKDILSRIAVRLSHEGEVAALSFLGRLNAKAGFYDFLKSFISYPVNMPRFTESFSSSLGCARYGSSRFLENISLPRQTLAQRLRTVCKDYF